MSQNSTMSPWFGVSMGLFGVIVGYALANAMTGVPLQGAVAQPSGQVAAAPSDAVPAAPIAPSDPASEDDDPFKGDANAKVSVIEFTDYQCPFCARHFTQTMGQIMANYVDTGDVKYVVRDYPLAFHGNAQISGEASECADEQGKFWEMHDKLFETQSAWSSSPTAGDIFKGYAAELGLDTDAFASCLDNGDMADEVKQDLADGSASGISGTPGFWIVNNETGEGKQVSGAFPYATFQAEIDAMLAM